MKKTLIIKLGALGDVLRTTPLLRRLSGQVTWVTGRDALPLLKDNPRVARPLTLADRAKLLREKFDWVINLEEDERACALAAELEAPRKTGALLGGGKPRYCGASAPWFDMSLISRLGRREADRLKYSARKPYQYYLFRACGFDFNGEEYILKAPGRAPRRPLVALEPHTGSRWPLKSWPGCDELAGLLRAEGVATFILRRRGLLADYLSDIARCTLLVSGDTLAMHAALALRRKAVAIFNCTSPWEIYGYGRLRKLRHPALRDNFYSTRLPGPAFRHIPAAAVLRAVMAALK